MIIITKSFDIGGAEKLAVLYANIFNEITQISLVVLDDYANDNKLLEELDEGIPFKYLIKNSFISKMIYFRENRRRIKVYRALYDLLLSIRRLLLYLKLKKIINENKENYIVDFFDMVPHRLLNEKCICWIHSSISRRRKNELKEMRKRYAKVKYVIVISDTMKKEFVKCFPELKEKVKLVKNPFDFDLLKKMGDDRSELRKNEEKIIESKYILACTRLDSNSKDIPTLISAFVKSKLSENNFLVILGHGQQKNELEELIERLECQNKVFLLGKKSNPYIWMKNCEFFVHSSKMEGFGMVLVEAMFFSKLVVASDCPGAPREILKSGEAGILFEVGNLEELKNIFDKLANEKLDIKSKIKCASNALTQYSREGAKKMIGAIIEKNS